jgi:signal transduction histidine kinase
MDAAIKDLRASIFELGGRGTIAADVGAAIEDICAESAGMLGFRPDTTVDDPRLRARDFRDEVLTALREALANVARHAGARHVDVTLRARDGVLVLKVTDDGRGRGADEPGTGARIMTESARRHGGDCTWTPVQPHGTQVRWTVPLG